MADAEKSIVVGVPVDRARRCWATVEELPNFLVGVSDVHRTEDGVEWVEDLVGHPQPWSFAVREDARRVAYTGRSTARNVREVTFRPLGDAETLVTLRVERDLVEVPEGADAGGTNAVDRRTIDELERFRDFVERATGGVPDDEPAREDAATAADLVLPGIGDDLMDRSVLPPHGDHAIEEADDLRRATRDVDDISDGLVDGDGLGHRR